MASLATIDPASLSRGEIERLLHTLSTQDLKLLQWRVNWLKTARPKQLTPPDDWWHVWLVLAGRGFGKTLTGAQDIGWYSTVNPRVRCAVVAPTASDVRDTCFEGVSGLLNVIPQEAIESYNRSTSELVMFNGSIIKGFSAQEPERLRGPQFHRAWCDELAAWEKLRETWDMLMFGLRLGERPQVVATTTPKPVDLVRELVAQAKSDDGDVVITTGSSYENKANLAPTFFDQIAAYEGTQLGRQEIHAEVLDPEEGGIVKRSQFRLWPADKPIPKLEYIVQSYDTAYTDKTQNDPTACSVWGVFRREDAPPAVLLLDSWGEHLIYADLKEKVLDEYPSVYGDDPGRRTDLVLVEEKGSGISLIQDLQRAGVFVRAYNPGRADKVQRLHLVSNIIAAGRVFVPESTVRPGEPRDWCQPLISQACSFPNSSNDDYVDTMTQALRLLRDMGFLVIDPPPEDPDLYVDDTQPRRVNPYAE